MGLYREIPVGKKGDVALVDAEDYEWLSQWYWGILDSHRKSAKRRRYAVRYVSLEKGSNKCQTIWMHREILGIPREDRTAIGDHVNLNTLDNRRENLRIATKSQNTFNVGLRSNNTSGYKGVTFNKVHKKWVAGITANGKHTNLGFFDTPEAAHAAYQDAAAHLHKDFARVDSGCKGCANLRRDVRVLREALQEVEWSNGGFCPQCNRGPKKGHQEKCVVGAALRSGETK